MTPYQTLALAALLILLYAVLTRRLIGLARPVRLEQIWRGEELLASQALNEKEQNLIAASLERSNSAVDAWLTAILLIPAWLAAVIDMARGRPRMRESISTDVRNNWDRFVLISVIARLMNSPGALLLALVQIVLIMLTSVSMLAIAEHLEKLALLTRRGRDQRSPPKGHHA